MTAKLPPMTAGQADAPTPTGLKVLTGAGSIISAAHRNRDGQLHGHTWEVTAWWQAGPCAVERQQTLASYLSIFDHQVLGDEIAWGEALAVSILHGLDCVKVEVARPLERIYAIAERIAA